MTTTTLSPAARKIIDRVTDDAPAGAPTQALLDALCDGAYLEKIGVSDDDMPVVVEAYEYLEKHPVSYRYEIRDAHRTASCDLDAPIAACYLDSFSFEAGSDDEALEYVEELQRRDDAKAATLCEKEPKYRTQYESAPRYADALYRLGDGRYDVEA